MPGAWTRPNEVQGLRVSTSAHRSGVGASCIALPAQGPWPTVLAFLQQRFAHVPPEDWHARMARGEIFETQANGQDLTLSPDAPYRPQARIHYFRSVESEPRIPFEEAVLFQDEHLVVADKPHFLPVTPGGRYVQETLLVRLKRRLGLDSLQPLHRLDRETAGLVLFSVRPGDRDAYHALFRGRAVHKRYEAIAPYRQDLTLPLDHHSRIVDGDSFMRMQEQPGEPNAHTHISLLARQGDLARYALEPSTGRKHQLRVHLWGLGLPIVGDRIYPTLWPEEAEPTFAQPLQLLAQSLRFADPITGEQRFFQSGRHLQF